MSRTSVIPALVLFFCLAASAEDTLSWIRYPAISPDGSRICFSYGGDLWLVASTGGTAVPFTSHVSYERSPVWSRDSKSIAFASDRHGNFDVFVKAVDGGAARRLTYHSTRDLPTDFYPDGKRVLFSSARSGDPAANPASVRMAQLYSISLKGGAPKMVLSTQALHGRWNVDGTKLVYEGAPGRDNEWRKHHTSSAARDIWIYDVATRKHTRHTKSKHEDRDPSWDGDKIVYLNEDSGSLNVTGENGAGKTKFTKHPVRFLTRAKNGTLCFSWHGDLYVLAPGAEPKKLAVTATRSDRSNQRTTETFRKGATAFAVSPDETEVVFVVRGELFAASVAHGTTRRLTNTSSQERMPRWAPDGKSIYFSAERDGAWNIYRLSLGRAEDKHFFRSTVLVEEPVLVGEDEAFLPVPSPDGKRLAYVHNRDEIRVLDFESKNAWTVVPADRNYSYTDGDVQFAWSPDSKWLTFTILAQGRWLKNVGIVDAEGKQVTDMTRSGYWEGDPRFSRDGTALLFRSDRNGRRSHGGWGSDADVFALDLTQAAHDRAQLSEEEFDLLNPRKKKGRKRGGEDEDDGEDDEEDNAKKTDRPIKPVVVDLDGRETRVRRLTRHSAPLNDYALSPDGETLVSIARVGDTVGVWQTDWRKGETKRLMKLKGGRGDVRFAKNGKSVFVRSGDGRLFHVKLKGESKPIAFAAEMHVDRVAERAYVYGHAWRQVKRKFYTSTLHGVAWDEIRDAYAPFLAHINNNHDFAEMLSEVLGELNASHTGCYYRPPAIDATASLGLLFKGGDSFVVSEVLEGGPCALANVSIAAGSTLTHLDGAALTPDTNVSALLNHKSGKRTLIAYQLADGSKGEATITPISSGAESNLRYRRWIKQRRALTEKLSNGKVGYVHVRGMNDGSFRALYRDVLGRYGDRKALLIDTRNNGGGWLHDDLVKFLDGTPYGIFQPRGKQRGSMGGEPSARWSEAVAVLTNERNYSDAHIFPYAFQKLGLGPVVGAPVAGTGTAVWWERQIDSTLVFGIPQVGFVEPGTGDYLENKDLVPDHVVLHHPDDAAAGSDKQLEKAVELLMKDLSK